jgi:hypothetical protein
MFRPRGNYLGKECDMRKLVHRRITRLLFNSLLMLCITVCTAAFGQSRQISAVARGTSTQMGRIVNIDIRINSLSTAADQGILLEAFQANGSEGVANALDKMRSKGRIAITGTVGYDLNYIRRFKMPDGSVKIRFVTDRPITFGEHWYATRTVDYQLSMGEIIIRPGKGKSTGTLMPATRLRLNKKGELELETYQNPWELVNIKVWK